MQLSKLRGRRKHRQKDCLLHKWSQSQSCCSICVLFKILFVSQATLTATRQFRVCMCVHMTVARQCYRGRDRKSTAETQFSDCLLDGYENKHYKLLRASCIIVFDFNHITTGSSGKGSTTLCSVFL